MVTVHWEFFFNHRTLNTEDLELKNQYPQIWSFGRQCIENCSLSEEMCDKISGCTRL